MSKVKFFGLTAIAITLIFPYPIFAGDRIFDANAIITDNDMFSVEWNSSDIQLFLATKPGTLANYRVADIDGIVKNAADIIFNAAKTYTVNPKFLIAMLQKEQGLITDASPTQKKYDWAMGYGVCDGCDLTDPTKAIFKGFANQIDRCAGLMRWYVENQTLSWLKKVGGAYTIDGQDIVISNQATANLYNYTPHVTGNFNLWDIWGDFYGDTISLPSAPIYPDGSLLKVKDDPTIWLIQKNKRRAFTNWPAFVSRYDTKMIVQIDKTELLKFEQGKDIKLAQYSLLQLPTGGRYLVDGLTIRRFESNDVFKSLGFNPEEITKVDEIDIMGYVLGEPITIKDSFPLGGLLQDKTIGAVFYLKNGVKYPIWGKDIMLFNYPTLKIVKVSPKELDKYKTGDPVLPKDGALVKVFDNDAIYVVANGIRRLVPTNVFTKLGYDNKNVMVVSKQIMNFLALGADLTL
ncbi:hypothetical protein HY932_03510 [Candidatus Falkowbacteria bacterium]|nr:hypothetical protein [Candidatus Falkowbacteria bacterium]